jgi:hypothetical protein
MSIRRFRSAVGAALVAVLAGTTLAAGPAAAAESKTVATAKPVVTKHSILTAASAGSERVCSVSFNNVYFGGASFCNYNVAYCQFPDGTYQLFVVGTDYGVWTRWLNPDGTLHPSTGWYNMGGQVKRGNPENPSLLAYLSPWVDPGAGWWPELDVYGNETNYITWDRLKNEYGEWTPWARRES